MSEKSSFESTLLHVHSSTDQQQNKAQTFLDTVISDTDRDPTLSLDLKVAAGGDELVRASRPESSKRPPNDLINDQTIRHFTSSAFKVEEMKKAIKAYRQSELTRLKTEFNDELFALL